MTPAAAPVDLPFQTGSAVHLTALVVCATVVVVFAAIARRARSLTDGTQRRIRLAQLRRFVGWGCLTVWLMNSLFWWFVAPFSWGQSLPLHFCNLANLFGAIAVLRGNRLFKAVLYFWMTTLCIWAFLTPVLGSGPEGAEFWIFWIYHLFIPLAVTETIFVQGFRPSTRDLGQAWLFTIIFAGLLTIPDNQFGWNYGFVGPSTPQNPTLLDVLGPYPLRLLWMVLIGTALFTVAWLPWRRRSIQS